MPPPCRCRGACALLAAGSPLGCCGTARFERGRSVLRPPQASAASRKGGIARPSTPSDPRAIAAAAHRLSSTVSDEKICATWNEREIPSRVIAREGSPVMSRSSNAIRPLVGRKCPVIMLTKVVLPAPLAPMIPTVCCGGTSTEMSRAATRLPKVFSRSRTERIGVMAHESPGGAIARKSSRGRRAGTRW